MREFQNKTYWIVGASEGLGRALAIHFAETGDKVIITPLFIGVDNSKPLKKANMLVHMPKIDAKTILSISFDWIFSLGVKKLIIQKRLVAPKSLSIIKPDEPI